ncbi:hypothetical protein BKA70DRAFT_1239221 [Coprinopsis sp. MPI-PUGE-AT-0042]|nr:hypothetical protein BKA70DRAFT_1239221 [Coprinopsis sp. MPI-PUGE-AT-0042]
MKGFYDHTNQALFFMMTDLNSDVIRHHFNRLRFTSAQNGHKRLQEPIVSCALSKLYNKDAIIEFLLDKSTYGDGEEICGHVRSLGAAVRLPGVPNMCDRPYLTCAPCRTFVINIADCTGINHRKH